MANLNLSQFTEKTLVADADWVFVWDTAGAISKKVSRNSLLNSGTLATSAPVTISQTWNDAAQTFKALVVNAAGTSAANSAAGSLLLDLQVGGVSQFKIDKTAHIFVSNPNSRLDININNVPVAAFFAGGLMRTYGSLGFSETTTFPNDLILTRDGPAQLALRNGTNAQTFNVYGTWTTAITNFERLAIKYNTSDLAYQIAAEKGTTNGDYRPLDFVTGGSRRMTIGTTGNVGIGTTAPSSKLEVVGAVTVSTYIKVSPVAVTSLPDAATAGVGARAFVNDALAPVFGSAVANGGSAKVPVYSDGSAWYVG